MIRIKKPSLDEKDKALLAKKIHAVNELFSQEGIKFLFEYMATLDKLYTESLTSGSIRPKEGISMEEFVGFNRGALSYGSDVRGFFRYYEAMGKKAVEEKK